MYSQLTNINYNKNMKPATSARVGDLIVDGEFNLGGRDQSQIPTVVVPTGQLIGRPVMIVDRVFTVNGVATLDYTAAGLTGSFVPRVYVSVVDPVLVPANNACWAIVTSRSATQAIASIYRVQAGAMELYNVSGVEVSFLVVGSEA